jgi:hypothetical protein
MVCGILMITTANHHSARRIFEMLLVCQNMSTLSRHELCQVVALMSMDQWRTVALTAGVAVAGLETKVWVLSLLRGRAIHAVHSTMSDG